MQRGRSDLALEAAENLGFGTAKWRELSGVTAVESRRQGYAVTAITVASARASAALDKPVGRYVTIDLRPYFRREAGFFPRAAACVASSQCCTSRNTASRATRSTTAFPSSSKWRLDA